MSNREKDQIEERFGPLWSGKTEVVVAGKSRTLREVARGFDLVCDDVVSIDLHEISRDRFAFRFYDGDDRCVVVFVFDAVGEIHEELRAHIAEWLGEIYDQTGPFSTNAIKMALLLRRKVEVES